MSAPAGYCDILQRVRIDTRDILNRMATEYDFRNRNEVLDHIARAYAEGRLLILDRLTRDVLVGAAKEETLTQAKRVAAAEVRYQLWQEGYRADPYEH